MYITPHATIGIMIGERVGNPLLGFFLGVCSHFICDIIPHGDTQMDAWVEKNGANKRMVTYLMATIDYALMITMLWYIAPTLIITPSVVTSAIGAIVPDVLWAWYDISKWKFLALYTHVHHQLHHVLPCDIPYTLGLLYQIILVVFLFSLRT